MVRNNVNSFKYSDDMVLTADPEEKLQKLENGLEDKNKPSRSDWSHKSQW